MTDTSQAPLNPSSPPAWRAIVTKVCVNLVTAGAVYVNAKFGIQLDAETQGLLVAVAFAGANALAHWVIAEIPGLTKQ